MSPRFSVIIPACNVAEHIEATLQSVWNQSFSDYEVIVVDDGSVDGTPDILAAQTDARLTVIRTANQGVSHARNTAIRHASGDCLAFLDGDDLWYPDHLEKAHAFFSQHPEVNWYAARFVAGPELPERREDGGVGEDAFSLLNFFRSGHMRTWTSCVVLKKSGLGEGELFPEELTQGEDTVAWMRYAATNPILGVCSRETAFYRTREASATHTRPSAMEAVIDYEKRFYEAFRGLTPPCGADRLYGQLRRCELFASSFSFILRQASLGTLLPVIREHRKSMGFLLWLYMACVVCLFRVLSALFRLPLQTSIRVYRKIMRTWPQ